MGTNYYWHRNACPHCGRCDADDTLHVGKSSAGWSFSFHAVEGIRSAADWRREMREVPGILKNEYGEIVAVNEFWRMVEGKRGGLNHAARYPDQRNWVDPEGHSFSAYEFS